MIKQSLSQAIIMLGLMLIFFLLTFLNFSPVWAIDNLFLCGKLQNIKGNRLYIKVFSKTNCNPHYFEFKKNRYKEYSFKFKKGQKICFLIEESSCEHPTLTIIKFLPPIKGEGE